jgi:hypothetical protein
MKMNYLKIRADFKYATKGRFYRIFLVKEDIIHMHIRKKALLHLLEF